MAGIDTTNYQRWEKVTAPNGAVYYVVPESGLLFSPVISQMKGRNVFFTDPRQAAEKQAKQEKLVEQQNSIAGQLAPVAGAAIAPIAAKGVANYLFPTAAEQLAEATAAQELAALQAAQGSQTAGAAFAGAANAPATPTGLAASQVGSNVGGGVGGGGGGGVVPPPAEGLGIGPYLGVAGMGLGAYGVHNAIDANDPKSGFLSGAGFGAGLGAALPLLGIPGLGWGAMGLMALGGGGLGAGLTSLLGHKSTKERESDRWSGVGRQDLDVVGKDYFAGTGGEKSRDEKFLTPDAIRSNPDNYHAAEDWDSWEKSQQDQFLSTLLAEGKVQERKGGIYYDDARAKELAAQIRGAGAVAQPVPTTRSKTQSPGIDMNGRRIAYQLASSMDGRR